MALKINIDILAKLMGLPKAAKIAIAVVPSLIVIGLVVFLAVMPKRAQIEVLRDEIAKQEAEIAKSQSMAGKLDELKAENAKLKERLAALQEHLPEEGEIESLLKQVSDLAIEAGLKIGSWKPAARKKHESGIVYEVPVAVTFSGSYHKLGIFFASLTGLDRIVNVQGLKLGGSGQARNNEVTLGITFTAVTFTAVEEEGIAK
jgi:type IV pilus assembly protein PilO